MQRCRGLSRWREASTPFRPLDMHNELLNNPDWQVTAKQLINMSKQTNWSWLESNSYLLDNGLQLVDLADALTIWASWPANLTTVHCFCVSSFNYIFVLSMWAKYHVKEHYWLVNAETCNGSQSHLGFQRMKVSKVINSALSSPNSAFNGMSIWNSIRQQIFFNNYPIDFTLALWKQNFGYFSI